MTTNLTQHMHSPSMRFESRCARQIVRTVLIVGLMGAAACRSSSEPIRISPDAVGSDQGTLISIGDIRNVAQVMIDSMNENRRLASLRREQSPLKILLGDFKQRTSIAIFDKEIFVNRILSSLNRWDVDGVYSFIRRDDVRAERQLQESGAVEPDLSTKMTGADYVLSGEVRELLHRQPEAGGGEVEKRTVQYTLALSKVSDATLVWTYAHEVVKLQVIGAIYR